MRESVPTARYSPVCSVLRQWKTSLILTYRVYRLYDIYSPQTFLLPITHVHIIDYHNYTLYFWLSSSCTFKPMRVPHQFINSLKIIIVSFSYHARIYQYGIKNMYYISLQFLIRTSQLEVSGLARARRRRTNYGYN